MQVPVYMDNHATTRCDPRVVEAMLPYFGERFGNAASLTHVFGRVAWEAVEGARQQVADLLGASPREIVFTSGATESDNLAIKGTALGLRERRNHIVTVVTEHRAVLDACRSLEAVGFETTRLAVGGDGLIDVADVRGALTEKTCLVSVMAANNEIGVLQPIGEIGALAKERGILFHTDAAQAAGRIPLLVNEIGADLVSISAHKVYGPKGAGALYVRRGDPKVTLVPLLDGGGHERGMRSGTLNVPGIVGLGMACELARLDMAEENKRLRALRDRLLAGLEREVGGVHVNGSLEHRLAGNLSVSFDGADGGSLLALLDDVAVSSGAACASGAQEPSHVLRALGIGDELANGSVRFGLGRFNTEAEVDYTIGRVVAHVQRLRATMPSYELKGVTT